MLIVIYSKVFNLVFKDDLGQECRIVSSIPTLSTKYVCCCLDLTSKIDSQSSFNNKRIKGHQSFEADDEKGKH
jgi:hypothetical protein